MRNTHRWLVVTIVLISNIFSQNVSVRDINKDPRNYVNVSVTGVLQSDRTMCTLIACMNSGCCNSCLLDNQRVDDGSGSIEIGPMVDNAFAVRFSRALTVSECHQKNLRFFSSTYSLEGSGGVLTYSDPGMESPSFSYSKVREVNHSLLYIKDTVFIDHRTANSIDNSIIIFNPQVQAITIDSIFTDSLELDSREQGVSITVADTANVSNTFNYTIVPLTNQTHKYVLVCNESKSGITVPSGSWVTLSLFRYTTAPGTSSSIVSQYDHDPFTLKLYMKNSQKETELLIVKYADEHTSTVLPSRVHHSPHFNLPETQWFGISGRRTSEYSNASRIVVSSCGERSMIAKSKIIK